MRFIKIRNVKYVFPIIFLLALLNCNSDLSTLSVEKRTTTIPVPDNNTIVLLIRLPNIGQAVGTTYDYKNFYTLTCIPYVLFVDWSPDKQWLVYIQTLQEKGELVKEVWRMKYDGSDKKILSKNEKYCFSPRFSPSGSKIMFTAHENNIDKITTKIITCDIFGNQYNEIFISEQLPENCSAWGQCWKTDDDILFTYYDEHTISPHVGLINIVSKKISYITYLDTLDPYIIQWSPVRDEMAFVGKGYPGTQVWAINGDGTNLRKLSDCFLANAPDWSSDGEKVIFSQLTNGFEDNYTVWVVNRDGTNLHQLLKKNGFDLVDPAW